MRISIQIRRVCILLLTVALLFCAGCSKQWSDDKGYIYRNDIELEDFAFLFEEWNYNPAQPDREAAQELYNAFKRDSVKPNDIFDALGLPGSTQELYGRIQFIYTIGTEGDTFAILYIPAKDELFDIDPSLSSLEGGDELYFEIMSSGGESIKPNQYKMSMRFDIREDELEFIDEDTTSAQLQREFGAPHYYIETFKMRSEGIYTNVFAYELENGNVFKVTYLREGRIFLAWIEDRDGSEIKRYVDRDEKVYFDDFYNIE